MEDHSGLTFPSSPRLTHLQAESVSNPRFFFFCLFSSLSLLLVMTACCAFFILLGLVEAAVDAAPEAGVFT